MGITQKSLQELIDVADLNFGSKYDPLKVINTINTTRNDLLKAACIVPPNLSAGTGGGLARLSAEATP